MSTKYVKDTRPNSNLYTDNYILTSYKTKSRLYIEDFRLKLLVVSALSFSNSTKVKSSEKSSIAYFSFQ